jgi:hypothetical protein
MEQLKYTLFKVFHYLDKLNSLPKEVEEIKPPLHVRIKPKNIYADQNIYLCQDKAYTSVRRLGNIENQSFLGFWNNSKDKFFDTNPSKHCLHHCVSDKRMK